MTNRTTSSTIPARIIAAMIGLAVAGLATGAEAGCQPFPKVPWWGNLTHGKVIRYVRNRLDGDWERHIGHYTFLHSKLLEIRDNGGAAVIRKQGIRLEGEALDDYIGNIETRIEVILCLAQHASGNYSSGHPSRPDEPNSRG